MVKNIIEKALESWYKEEHPLRLDPTHPLLGMAGEAGELLNLYKKNEYKPNFSWWDCKHCLKDKSGHMGDNLLCYHDKNSYYTPKIIDELGDFWYYFRIICWQQNIEIWQPETTLVIDKFEMCFNKLNLLSARLLDKYMELDTLGTSYEVRNDLKTIFRWFIYILNYLNCSLDKLTELNYEKLSTPNQNGWSSAREVS